MKYIKEKVIDERLFKLMCGSVSKALDDKDIIKTMEKEFSTEGKAMLTKCFRDPLDDVENQWYGIQIKFTRTTKRPKVTKSI